MRALVVLVVTALAATASADVHVLAPAKVSVDIPASWHIDAKASNMIRAASADQAVALVLWSIDDPSLSAATKEVDAQLVGVVKHQKWGRAQEDDLHGMRAYAVDGSGVSGGGNTVDLFVMIVGPTPSKKGAIVLAAVDHTKLDANWKALDAALRSVSPVK
jgi:hypothetical protein